MATYANGDVYEGTFLNGRRQGEGTMRYATGQTETGEWRDGALATPVEAPATDGTTDATTTDGATTTDTPPAEAAIDSVPTAEETTPPASDSGN